MASQKTVLLIMGSTRAGRICPRIAQWVAQIGRAQTGHAFEIVDLADWPLPMDDEPGIPAMGNYVQPHTQAWSAKIRSADAVIFVTPQYNWGYPAVLKNAVDHLYHEWRDKPAMILSYGGHGGGKCADQFRQVAGAVHMKLVPTSPGITLPEGVIRQGAPFDPASDFQQSLPSIRAALGELAAQINPVSAS